MQIVASDLVNSVMSERPETVAIFVRYRMLCVGCVVGPFHTIDDACSEHGVNVDEFLGILNGEAVIAR